MADSPGAGSPGADSLGGGPLERPNIKDLRSYGRIRTRRRIERTPRDADTGTPQRSAGRADRGRWTPARYWIFQEPSGCRQATP